MDFASNATLGYVLDDVTFEGEGNGMADIIHATFNKVSLISDISGNNKRGIALRNFDFYSRFIAVFLWGGLKITKPRSFSVKIC